MRGRHDSFAPRRPGTRLHLHARPDNEPPLLALPSCGRGRRLDECLHVLPHRSRGGPVVAVYEVVDERRVVEARIPEQLREHVGLELGHLAAVGLSLALGKVCRSKDVASESRQRPQPKPSVGALTVRRACCGKALDILAKHVIVREREEVAVAPVEERDIIPDPQRSPIGQLLPALNVLRRATVLMASRSGQRDCWFTRIEKAAAYVVAIPVAVGPHARQAVWIGAAPLVDVGGVVDKVRDGKVLIPSR